MPKLNSILKLVFILSALALFVSMTTAPKTHCQVCELEWEGEIIDGYDAFSIFEDACLTYSKPWEEQNMEVPILNGTLPY